MGYDKDNNAQMSIVENVIGCKWSLRVIDAIRRGHRRPARIRQAIPGISDKVLNERLKKLTRFGLTIRKIYPVTPPKVEYRFSSKGRRFLKVIDAIARF